MSKQHEIPMGVSVNLPAVTTDDGSRPCFMMNFLSEWVVGAPKMREDVNLEHLFEWEEVVEAFGLRMAEKAAVTVPEAPKGATDKEAVTSFMKAVQDYRDAVNAASKDESLFVSSDAYKVGLQAAKEALDSACTPNQYGQVRLHPVRAPKLLRLYFALKNARQVDKS